jgi:hypothetical protein
LARASYGWFAVYGRKCIACGSIFASKKLNDCLKDPIHCYTCRIKEGVMDEVKLKTEPGTYLYTTTDESLLGPFRDHKTAIERATEWVKEDLLDPEEIRIFVVSEVLSLSEALPNHGE